MGVLELAVVCVFMPLQLLHHHVRTASGDSPDFFCWEECLVVDYQGQILQTEQKFLEPPGHGCGQGNSAGPTYWVLFSTPLLQDLQAEGCGSQFKGVVSNTELVFVAYALSMTQT